MTPRAGRGATTLLAVALCPALACTAEHGAQPSGARVDSAVNAPATRRMPDLALHADYVGLEYDALPHGFRDEGGAVIPRGPGGFAGDFAFAHVSTPRGEMVWLDTLGAPSTGAGGAGGRPHRVVRAALRVPPLASDEHLFMGSCDVGGRVDGRIVAIAVTAPGTARSTLVRQAWRANPAAEQFELVPVTGIACEEPGS